MTHPNRAYLGLGSNRDRPHRQITKAIGHINHLPGTHIVQLAPRYRTEAWGFTEQPDFINTVIAIQTTLTPMHLLKRIKRIEYRLMGRQRNKRWHSRCIDIDILYYSRQPFRRASLQLPHPDMPRRCFVLRPLLDCDPEFLPRTTAQKITIRKNLCKHLRSQRHWLETHKIRQICHRSP